MIVLDKLFSGEMMATTIIGLFGIIVFVKVNIKKYGPLLLLFLLAMLWRAVLAQIITFTTRYLITVHLLLLIVSSYYISYLFKSIHLKGLATALVLFAWFYQTYKTYSSFNNIYIMDIKSIVDQKAEYDDRSTFAIEGKEFFRLKNNTYDRIAFPIEKKLANLEYFIDSYLMWEHPLYIISAIKKDNAVGDLSEKMNQIKTISSFRTNKKNRRVYVYRYPPSPAGLTRPLVRQTEDNADNLIVNGNFESVESPVVIRRKFRKWIENGFSFYSQDGIKLPEYQFLLPTDWDIKRGSNYPIVFLDEKDSIEGKYSLHIIFNNLNQDYPVCFLNKFKADDGYLEFTVRSIDAKTLFVLRRVDYESSGKWINYPIDYYFYISDLSNHTFHIELSKDEFLGPLTMFRIATKNADFLLDNIKFIPSYSGK